MSPERGLLRSQLSASNSKPYVRSKLPAVLPSGTPNLVDYNALSTPSTPDSFVHHIERPGFPTYTQYKQIETNYIESLTPRRQGKALISQSMFDRIWDVLHHPESQMETAQFRFWARKMFTVSKDYRITLGVPDGVESPLQEVLLHDNLLVAIQEQLYDLLCYCHASTGHGGRDKTCALIRKHYTWVPKDLVSNFIKACPTCIMKKCGNVDVNSPIPQLMAEADRMSARLISRELDAPATTSAAFHESPFAAKSSSSSQAAFQDSTNSYHSPELSWSSPGGSLQSVSMTPSLPQHSTVASSPSGFPFTFHGGHDENIYPTTVLHPMVREVSLYRGLPNGWQYRHDDFETAHSEFMEYKKQWETTNMDMDSSEGGGELGDPNFQLGMPPRVPSIAGMWGPEHFRSATIKEEEEELDLMYPRPTLAIPKHPLPAMSRALNISDSGLPPILFGMGSPRLSEGFLNDIDPALLALPGSRSLSVDHHHSHSQASLHGPGHADLSHGGSIEVDENHDIHSEGEPDPAELESALNALPPSNSFKCSNAPHRLVLGKSDLNHALHQLIASSGEEGEEGKGWSKLTSPTSSNESYASQALSPFPRAETDDITPGSSAGSTPNDLDDKSALSKMQAALKEHAEVEGAHVLQEPHVLQEAHIFQEEAQVLQEERPQYAGYAY